jgi:hypothetical protein
MSILALIISIIALVFAYKAYQLSGGTAEELKTKIDDLGISTENLRKKSADAVNRFEKIIRGEKKEEDTCEEAGIIEQQEEADETDKDNNADETKE